MKYLLKIFVVSVLTCCVTTRVSCATKGASGDLDFVVKVTDYKGMALPFVSLKTKKYEAKTNINGYATFKNACQAFRDANVVKVTISDSSGRNYEQRIPTQNAVLCSYNMKLAPLTTMSYAPADQFPLPAAKGAKKTKFYNLCQTGTKIPSGVKGGCVKIFDKVNTQYEIGKALAQEYVYEYFKKHKNVGANSDPKITCSFEIRKSNNNDFLSCATMDGKYVFEFQFDDLNESWGNDIRYTTLEGLCTLYGGSISPKPHTYCTGEQITTEELCKKLNRVSKTFSFSTVYKKDKGNCYVTFKIKGADEPAKSYSVLRYDVFQNYQTKFDNSTKVLIGRYVESTLGDDFQSLKCASMPVTWYRKYRRDDIIECTLRVKSKKEPYKIESYKIEFVFDDLFELSDTTSQGDTSQMGCLVDGGTYVAGKCAGVSLEQCNALGSQFRVKTEFNRELQMCELLDAKRQENIREGLDTLVAAGSIVLAVVTIVGTGGAAAPAVFVVAANVASIVNSGLSVYNMDVEDRANSEADKLMVLINNCGCETDCTNGKCKACARCTECKYKEIYEKLPSVLTKADYGYAVVLEKELASIKPCIATQKEFNMLEKQLIVDLKTEWAVKDTLAGIESFTGLMSVVSPGGGKNLLKTKKFKDVVNETVDVTLRLNTANSVSQSDSTSTTQPPNQ